MISPRMISPRMISPRMNQRGTREKSKIEPIILNIETKDIKLDTNEKKFAPNNMKSPRMNQHDTIE